MTHTCKVYYEPPKGDPYVVQLSWVTLAYKSTFIFMMTPGLHCTLCLHNVVHVCILFVEPVMMHIHPFLLPSSLPYLSLLSLRYKLVIGYYHWTERNSWSSPPKTVSKHLHVPIYLWPHGYHVHCENLLVVPVTISLAYMYMCMHICCNTTP